MKKVTVIGGGTGTFVVLSGLKNYSLSLSVVVSMMDSGGSTGKLRDQLGVLPPGDLRQCLVALSDAPILWRKLFLYRFEHGDLLGHNFGNIFLSALEKVSTDYQEVIDTVSYVLKIRGKVIPVTFKRTNLSVQYSNKKIVKGEGNIDENYKEKTRIIRAYLTPKVSANLAAIKQILDTDYIIAGPGDIYTSIVPVLLTNGIKDALKKTRAKLIYIMNLMTKSGQTSNYSASDHIHDLAYYFAREPDTVVINSGKIPYEIIKWYEARDEHPVLNDLTKSNFRGKIIREDIIGRKKIQKSESDILTRSVLRHDPNKLAKVLLKIIND